MTPERDLLATLDEYADAYCAKDIDRLMRLFDEGDDVSVIGTGEDELCSGRAEIRISSAEISRKQPPTRLIGTGPRSRFAEIPESSPHRSRSISTSTTSQCRYRSAGPLLSVAATTAGFGCTGTRHQLQAANEPVPPTPRTSRPTTLEPTQATSTQPTTARPHRGT